MKFESERLIAFEELAFSVCLKSCTYIPSCRVTAMTRIQSPSCFPANPVLQ
jgi:hypothetical protein